MRPFLLDIEKMWITYQMIQGVASIHRHGLTHGDLKCENVMVTSYNWVYITDFAPYKPTYVPRVLCSVLLMV